MQIVWNLIPLMNTLMNAYGHDGFIINYEHVWFDGKYGFYFGIVHMKYIVGRKLLHINGTNHDAFTFGHSNFQ